MRTRYQQKRASLVRSQLGDYPYLVAGVVARHYMSMSNIAQTLYHSANLPDSPEKDELIGRILNQIQEQHYVDFGQEAPWKKVEQHED